jgi:hypothetical protein
MWLLRSIGLDRREYFGPLDLYSRFASCKSAGLAQKTAYYILYPEVRLLREGIRTKCFIKYTSVDVFCAPNYKE